MNKKGLVLISGGLDSAVALGVTMRQKIELEAVSYFSAFSDGIKEGTMGYWARKTAEHFNVKSHFMFLREEFIDMIRSPIYGYGIGLNPCIDCKILMLKKSKELMKKVGASFLITGEVLGERPMSQNRRSIELIEKKADLQGLIVRPLSGKYFPPTKPEKSGIIDREKLLDIQGRGRQRQIELASRFGIASYPQPAGGCILTDKNFTKRVNDLFKYGYSSLRQIISLRYGRHFRLSGGAKVVIGRDEEENNMILRLSDDKDTIFTLTHVPGPLLILSGEDTDENILKAASLVKYFSKERNKNKTEVTYYKRVKGEGRKIMAGKISPEHVSSLQIV